MSKRLLAVLALLALALPLAAQMNRPRPTHLKRSGDFERFRENWRVLEPITRRNLTVYPVVSTLKVDTSEFLTLDEGLASGAIRIGERGQMENALYRRRHASPGFEYPEQFPAGGGASVNELVLVNSSSRPLILLAGEVVAGGKQNRIIGADLVVPPKSDPLPLTVFCVEHGRWSAGGGAFGAAKTIAHPGIRRDAQVTKSQTEVWERVEGSASALAAASPTSSYQDVVTSPRAKRAFDEVASSIEAEYEKELREQLRGRDAVGVVVAVNGELIWSDLFPNQDLFQKYWPKLLRSYVMEAEGRGKVLKGVPSVKEAETFLREAGGRMTVTVEPDAYRRSEISAPEYQIVALEAIGKFGDSGLLMHYNKMSRE